MDWRTRLAELRLKATKDRWAELLAEDALKDGHFTQADVDLARLKAEWSWHEYAKALAAYSNAVDEVRS